MAEGDPGQGWGSREDREEDIFLSKASMPAHSDATGCQGLRGDGEKQGQRQEFFSNPQCARRDATLESGPSLSLASWPLRVAFLRLKCSAHLFH